MCHQDNLCWKSNLVWSRLDFKIRDKHTETAPTRRGCMESETTELEKQNKQHQIGHCRMFNQSHASGTNKEVLSMRSDGTVTAVSLPKITLDNCTSNSMAVEEFSQCLSCSMLP